ncbi:hypothetical protein Hoch_3111 [Haliangium ochraceum DSM 14365]|uniref:Uncharacterized protein n=1 Tax=Haliangium ochraceum (strain DSM 14365 / JCM 11303 / SMP-2) TaxID=502025 RepID=D0LSB4_HALO1|nr:hypothetical protein Hoch_3111 [Haliangium ochraceum DSM 14365]
MVHALVTRRGDDAPLLPRALAIAAPLVAAGDAG